MLVTVLDFETTGVDSGKDQILEIGAVVVDTRLKRMVTAFSQITAPIHPVDPNIYTEITPLTGLTEPLVSSFGIEAGHAGEVLEAMIGLSTNFICAHNAPFEKAFVERYWPSLATNLVWLDTATDLELPPHYKGGHSLGQLCYESHISNPFPHSALGDAMATALLLMSCDIEKTVDNATATKVEVIAMVSYDNRQQAKDAGFRFDGNGKAWKKTIKEKDLDDLKAGWPFAVQIVQPVKTYKSETVEPFLEPANV